MKNADESNVAGKLGYAAIPYGKQPAGLLQTWALGRPGRQQEQGRSLQARGVARQQEGARRRSAQTDPSFISFRASLSSDPEIAKNAPWLAAANKALRTA